MTTIVKKKTPIVVPDALRRRAGMAPGDRVEMKALGGVITIVAESPDEPDEYTPDQRRIINARIAEARRGPYYGPFNTAGEAITFLHKEKRSRKVSSKKPRQ